MKLQIKSLYLLCFATGAMLLSSCEDFLDRQEDEKTDFRKNLGVKKYDQAVLAQCNVISS